MGEAYLEDPDVQLMLRVKDGDQDAFAVLVDRHAPLLVNYMTRFVGTQTSGEDLAQEVFLKVWRAAPGYEPRARFKTWLLTIATNVSLNCKRWQSRRPFLSLDRGADDGDRAGIEQVAGREPSPVDLPETEELKRQVREAIADLPEQQRAALIMSRYEQLPYADIAEALDVSVMAVKSLVNRAKEGLKKRLAPVLKDWYPQDPAVQRADYEELRP
ncbi:MAG: sigma-70 family RNA polymerase sigma factor [Planctomycetes bacterium]|nr:sigma-70 family RNA polymerase sigma factor [Planctomycetota bacterium]